jgi:ribosome maturation factor RimP
MSAAQTKALRALAEPIVTSLDCDLESVSIRQAGRRRLVRIVVDHDGGLPLDLVAQVSRELSRALDDSDVLGQSAYVLEVTSPGVDRPLTSARHWARARGRLVAVTLRDGEALTGRVRSADGAEALLDVEGAATTVRLDDVTRAVVQVELNRVDEVDLTEDDGDPDIADEDQEA